MSQQTPAVISDEALKKAEEFIEAEEGATNKLAGWLGTAVALAAIEVGTPQIRNQGTVGGNLNQRPRCWYFRNEEFVCFKKGGNRCFAPAGETTEEVDLPARLHADLRELLAHVLRHARVLVAERHKVDRDAEAHAVGAARKVGVGFFAAASVNPAPKHKNPSEGGCPVLP